MPQEKPLVKCSVSNCEYWNTGNNCRADLIMIEIDKHSNMRYHEEFAGEEFDSNHNDSASAASATCCHTFKAKKAQ